MQHRAAGLAGLLLIVSFGVSCELPQVTGDRPTRDAYGLTETVAETSETAGQTEGKSRTFADPVNFDLASINQHRSLAGQHAVEWDAEVARTAQLLAEEQKGSERARETLSAKMQEDLGTKWSMRSWSASGTGYPEQLHQEITRDTERAEAWLGDFDLVGIGAHRDRDKTRIVYLLVQSIEAHRATVVAALPVDPVGHTVKLINSTRAEQGLAPLERKAHADRVAQRWTEQMAASGALEHNPNFHADLADGIHDLAGSSENVGFSSEGLDAAHQGFVKSPGHYANMLGDHDAVGVGVIVDERGIIWVTHNFVTLGP